MHYFVNVTLANIYRKPTFHCEVDTQAVLWEKLEMLEKIDSFLRVKTEDHYEGWINEHQIEVCPQPEAEFKMVNALFQAIYEKADTSSEVIRWACAGAKLPVLSEQRSWFKVLLPDGQQGFIKNEAFGPMPHFGRKELVQTARKFLSVPYVWGGKTPYGLDCSGLVQLSCKLLGKNVRRDAWMQFEDSKPISDDPDAAQPGDFYFFSENGESITHVAIALGDKRFIHARGMVRINSLDEDDENFSPELLRDFVQVRTLF